MVVSRLFGLMLAALLPISILPAQTDVQVLGDAVFTPDELLEGATAMYLVRFQNNGSDTAHQIVLRDTLDQRLDANSFIMLQASHEYVLLRDNSNVIRWYFTEVELPNSASSEPDSYGFVLFTVQPKPFLTPGQVIPNRACVTFDQQQNECTNTAFLWIDENAGVEDEILEPKFRVVPNPNFGQFEIRSVDSGNPGAPTSPPKLETEWWITDISGKTIWDGKVADAASAGNQVLLEKPSPGLYLLWIKYEQDLTVQQFAVIR